MRRRVGVVAAVLLGFGAAALADELEAVEKRLQEAWSKHKSFTAKLQITQHIDLAGTVMDGQGNGSVEVQRQGDKTLVRMEMKQTMTNKTTEGETKSEHSILMVTDGEFTYSLSEFGGQKTVTKAKADPTTTGDPKVAFDDLRKRKFTLKLLPEETVGGRKVFVIEATPSAPEPGPMGMGKARYCFDQESGIPIQIIMLGADDKPMSTTAYTDLKIDPTIDPEHFKFTPPPGVQVIDQTGAKP